MTSPLLSWYGDDLTGSTDVMESLAARGIRTILFMRVPSPEELARFGSFQAIGLAGTSRSETPAWMDLHLTPAFEWLKSLDAGICHYKVCSTFDSSPGIGSIGKAAEIGQRVFGQDRTPLIVGAPQLKRYTAFGNLFAAFRAENFRIDRHPVMSRHPVTPMHEADLRLHLAQQTSQPIRLVDLVALQAGDADAKVDEAFAAPGIVLIDVADAATQALAGRQLWRQPDDVRRFVVGSSGIEYALLAEWQRLGLLPAHEGFTLPGAVDRIAVVSGSCSPTTERQIRHATANGFADIALDARVLAGDGREAAVADAVAAGLAHLAAGRSVILYTALGPQTDQGEAIDAAPEGRHRIGESLGRIQRALVEQAGLTRAVIAGGDTSSHALRQLDILGLTTRLPLPQTPGSPLCTAHSPTPAFDGLQVALKGGQVGGDDYFSQIREGRR